MQLEQLIALNDEIAALSRAGVPLARGLTELGSDLPSQLGEITSRLGQRMEQGESLEEALRNSPDEFPPVYRAVITAGVRSGKLTAATEGLATTLRRLVEVRRAVGFGMIYPILVLIVASLLFAFCLRDVFPAMLDTIRVFRLERLDLIEGWIKLLADYGLVLMLVPFFVLIGGGWWWRSTGRTQITSCSPGSAVYGWVPGAGRLIRNGQLATFTEVLRLLVRQKVALPEALTIAADATGSQSLRQDAARLSRRITTGDNSRWQSTSRTGLPPLLSWSLAGGLANADLAHTLARMSVGYQERAEAQSDWLRTTFPALATLVLAGTVAIVYSCSFLIPWLNILKQLSLQSI